MPADSGTYSHVQPSFELFDHTADIGVRVRAGSLAELATPAAEALYTVIGELVTGPGTPGSRVFDLSGDDPAVLLRDLLAELLFAFEHDRQIAVEIAVAEFTGDRLRATVQMAGLDGRRSVYHREVKAITYHQLGIRAIEGGYEAVYIVDV